MQNSFKSLITLSLLLQIAISLLFAIGAFIFPIYIFQRHGLGALPIYEGENVIGHASYFVISILVSIFMLLLGVIGYKTAIYGLRNLHTRKD